MNIASWGVGSFSTKYQKVTHTLCITTGISGGATLGVAQKICRREERNGPGWPGSQ